MDGKLSFQNVQELSNFKRAENILMRGFIIYSKPQSFSLSAKYARPKKIAAYRIASKITHSSE
jgi:hypothetical protein